MIGDAVSPGPEFLSSVQPIVLVGGRSTRFGRDKLRQPIGPAGEWLVQSPIRALRAVFGRRVKLVGACDPGVVALADGVIPDEYPGVGPIGGIASALRAWSGPVFVLAGDMPAFDEACVRRILAAACPAHGAMAILAHDGRAHPCAGLYAPAALPHLLSAIAAGTRSLDGAVPPNSVRHVAFASSSVLNINRQAQLAMEPREAPRLSPPAPA